MSFIVDDGYAKTANPPSNLAGWLNYLVSFASSGLQGLAQNYTRLCGFFLPTPESFEQGGFAWCGFELLQGRRGDKPSGRLLWSLPLGSALLALGLTLMVAHDLYWPFMF